MEIFEILAKVKSFYGIEYFITWGLNFKSVDLVNTTINFVLSGIYDIHFVLVWFKLFYSVVYILNSRDEKFVVMIYWGLRREC